MAVALELDEFDDLLDRLALADFLAPHGRQKQHFGERIGPDAGMAAGEQIVHHRHLREQFAVLEGAGDAEPRDVVRLRGPTMSRPRKRMAPSPR